MIQRLSHPSCPVLHQTRHQLEKESNPAVKGDGLCDRIKPDAGLMNPKDLLRVCQPQQLAQPPKDNWKKDLVNYLQIAHQAGFQNDKIPAAGFLDLDQEDGGMLSQRQKNHPAPGLFNVVIHGRRPYNVETMEPSKDRNELPFWNGSESKDSLLSTEQLANQIKQSLADQKVDPSLPVFLDACNAGTDLRGVVPARDLARELDRPVVAAVNSRVFQSVRGPVLQKQGAYWAAFYPDGRQETLWKPATPSGWTGMPK